MKISRLLSLLAVLAFSVSSARADYILTLLESGSNVVATGSGAFNFTGLVFISGGVTGTGGISPSSSGVVTGSGNGQVWGQVGGLPGITGPSSFGSGGYTAASSFTGGLTAMLFNGGTAPSFSGARGLYGWNYAIVWRDLE